MEWRNGEHFLNSEYWILVKVSDTALEKNKKIKNKRGVIITTGWGFKQIEKKKQL